MKFGPHDEIIFYVVQISPQLPLKLTLRAGTNRLDAFWKCGLDNILESQLH